MIQVFYFEPEVEENEDANESEGNSLNIFDGNKEVSNKVYPIQPSTHPFTFPK